MPLIIGRRHPVIEVEFLHEEPGIYELGEAVSVVENTGVLLVVYGLGASVSVTDGEIVSNYLIGGEAISESEVSGDLIRTFNLGEVISETFLDGDTFIYLSQISYSDSEIDFTYAMWLAAQAISETDTIGDLLRTYGLGETESDSDADFAWFATWYPGIAESDTEGLSSWAYLLRGSAESDSDVEGDILTTHQPGQTISDSLAEFPNWLFTYDLGETISEGLSQFGFTFLYTGETVSDTYGSWILSIRMGEAISETEGDYLFAGKALHDLIELDVILDKEVELDMALSREASLDTYIIHD